MAILLYTFYVVFIKNEYTKYELSIHKDVNKCTELLFIPIDRASPESFLSERLSSVPARAGLGER